MLRSPENVKDSIPLDMLDSDFGGHWKYEFNADKYWSTLLDFCGIAADGTRTHPSKARHCGEVDAESEEAEAHTSTGSSNTPSSAS